MRFSGSAGIWAVVVVAACSAGVFGWTNAHAATNVTARGEARHQKAAALRDGSHDFDFEIGTWHTELKILQHPLTGSKSWLECHGTSVVRKVWEGRANLVELEVDCPGHVEALSLRLYNPEAHQWSLNPATASGGTMSVPSVGEFHDGRGEFYDTEPVNGRSVLVRAIWSDVTVNSCRFEQSFSDDGGKTWEVNWIATDTRIQGL